MRVVNVVWLAVLGFAISGQCHMYTSSKCEVRLLTDVGWICGRIRIAEGSYKYASFRSVPYGKPPLGRRRFAELEPMDPWTGLWDATEDSAACPTKDLLYGRIYSPRKGMSEDCIYLNLHIPYTSANSTYYLKNTIDSSARLPILVNVPGGGYETGSGLTDFHGPEYLMTKGVIVVTFNYRLNVFGFLSLASKEIPGNQGLRDVYTLLRWVQRNAAAFGGDPDNVTLMGQSAGAGLTHLMSLSRVGEGLFHKIITLSGSGMNNGFTSYPENAAIVANAFLANLGINSTDLSYIHDRLVELPLENIMESFTINQNRNGVAFMSPVIEGEYPGVTRILEEEPLELIALGRGTQYPTLIGFTNNECEFFRWLYMNLNTVSRIENNHRSLIFGRLIYAVPEEVQDELAERVYDRCFGDGGVTLSDYINCENYRFIYTPLKLAEYRSVAGASTYLYRFSYEAQRKLVSEASWITYDGAAHVDDLTYVFKVNSLMGDYVSFPPRNDDDRMKDWMTTYFTNFMRCSNPTCDPEERNWPRVSLNNIMFQDITEPYQYTVRELDERLQDVMRFYDGIDVQHANITERLKAIRGLED